MESIFRVKCLFRFRRDENAIVEAINAFIASENMGYELTRKITENVTEPVNEYPFAGRIGTVIKTISEPQIVPKDNMVVHALVTEPVLTLLADPKFKSANQEYLEALEDYKKGDSGDCLTKCCSSFESTMKIICSTNGWPFKQTDTASTLIDLIIKNTALDSFFSQPLLIIATLRNRLERVLKLGTNCLNLPSKTFLFCYSGIQGSLIYRCYSY